jgi:hypothetical protein
MSQQLALHPLSFVEQGEDIVVGRVDTGSYAVLPSDGAELLRKLSDGMALEEAADWYEATYDEAVDMAEFVEALTELGFVSDGTSAPEQQSAPRFQWLGIALFSPAAFAVYAVLLISWFFLVSRHADLHPHSGQIFFSSSLLLVQATLFLSQIPLLFLHEGFHVLAGQRLGLHSKLSVSNRYGYLVFETQTNGLLSVPRRKRYLPFLAGVLLDAVMVGLLVLVADLTRTGDGSLSLLGKACLGIGFSVILRILWQFQLYLQTDLYYVFSTALNCHDLHLASKAITMNRLWRRLGRRDKLVDEDQWTERDRKVGSWYGILLTLGLIAAIALTIFGSLPIAISYFETAYRHLTSGNLDTKFWDAVISLSINTVELTAVFFLSRRKRRRNASRAPRLLLAESVV